MTKRRDRLRAQLPAFLRTYGRKKRHGLDPNDRDYDRKLEEEIKRMNPRDLDELLRDDDPPNST